MVFIIIKYSSGYKIAANARWRLVSNPKPLTSYGRFRTTIHDISQKSSSENSNFEWNQILILLKLVCIFSAINENENLSSQAKELGTAPSDISSTGIWWHKLLLCLPHPFSLVVSSCLIHSFMMFLVLIILSTMQGRSQPLVWAFLQRESEPDYSLWMLA